MSVPLDLEWITRGFWPDTHFYASVLWPAGGNPSRLAGDALGASNIAAYNSLRL